MLYGIIKLLYKEKNTMENIINGKVYAVKITEISEMTVYIEAESITEAEIIAEENWNNCEYILDADNFVCAKFKATENNQ